MSDERALFHDAMAHLASGVAVVTTGRPDGEPCGLAVTAVASFTAHPPSLLVSVDHGSRCHEHLAACEAFGVHLLSADDEPLARTFASREDHKFADVDWRWEDGVPELTGALAYLRCRRGENFVRYDHTILIGDLEGGWVGEGEPLLYAHRRMDWSLRASA